MIDIISDRLCKQVPNGKYTRWAETCTAESLEALLRAVGTFGREWNADESMPGSAPGPLGVEPQNTVEARLKRALEFFAWVQAGGDAVHESQHGENMFADPQSAFAQPFVARLATAEVSLSWAARLNERQLWNLLWQAGEYGVRIGRSRKLVDATVVFRVVSVPKVPSIAMGRALDIVSAVVRGSGTCGVGHDCE